MKSIFKLVLVHSELGINYRGVARGGAGGPDPPEFGRSVNPIQTREGQIMPRIQKAIYTSEFIDCF